MSLSQSNPRAREVLREEDNEGIVEEQTAKFLQQGQWRVVFINESWQLAKRLLIPQDKQPPRTKKHSTLHSCIVSRGM